MNTGVFCTQEELESIKGDAAAVKLAQMTATRLGPHAEALWLSLQKRVHALALERGLPEIEGFYGMDNEGQFLKAG